MPDEQPTTAKQFRIELHQQAWINTENFQVTAVDEADARRQADELLEGKDFGDEAHRVDITEIVPEDAAVATPETAEGEVVEAPSAPETASEDTTTAPDQPAQPQE